MSDAYTLDDAPRAPGPRSFSAVARHLPLVAICVLLAGLAGYFVANSRPTLYTAETTLTLDVDRPFDPLGTDRVLGDPTKWSVLQAAAVDSPPVLVRAAEIAGSRSPQDPLGRVIYENIEGASTPEFNRIMISATAPTPLNAKIAADAVAEAYREIVADGVAQKAVSATREVSDRTLRESIRVRAAIYGDGVGEVVEAPLPRTPSAPQPQRSAIFGGLLGLLIGTGAALMRDRWRRKQPSIDADPALALIPRLGQVSTVGRSRGGPVAPAGTPEADQYRMLLIAIGHLNKDQQPLRSLLVASVGGSTANLVTNLAVAALRNGRRVIIVDADDQGHGLAALGGPSAPEGVARSSVEQGAGPAVRLWTLSPDLAVQVIFHQSGQDEPGALRPVLDVLTEYVDLVLVAGGSLVDSPATFAIAGDADAVLLHIGPAGSSTVLATCAERLTVAGARIIGFVGDAGPARRRPWRRFRLRRRSSSRGAAERSVLPFPDQSDQPDRVLDRLTPRPARSKSRL